MATDPANLCEKVLDLVGPRAEAEVTASVSRSALTRFANSFIHQNVAEDGAGVRLRVAVGGRQAVAGTSRVDSDGLARLVEGALEAAAIRPADPMWPGLAPPAPSPEFDRYDGATHFAPPAARAEIVRDFVGAGDGLSAAGFCETSGVTVCFANSAGQRLTGRYSEAQVEGIHRTATSDGAGWEMSGWVSAIGGAGPGAEAAGTARRAAEPVDLEPGEYEVVLGPRCVADLFGFVSGYGFNGKAHAEGRSFVELGERQLDPALTLYDDAADPCALGTGFDAEGTPKRRVVLVDGGTSASLLHDRRTGLAAATGSTGHAVAGGESYGPWASNLFLAEGAAGGIEAMVQKVRRGILVSDFWYTRVVDPKSLVVTGLTRNGTFLIEGGEVTKAVSNLRFTQSYAEALAPGRVLAVGGDRRMVDRSACMPSLRLAAWRFTGGAAG